MTIERNYSVEVLDHGLLRLIDYMGSDLSVVRNARVSYDAAWRSGQNAAALCRVRAHALESPLSRWS